MSSAIYEDGISDIANPNFTVYRLLDISHPRVLRHLIWSFIDVDRRVGSQSGTTAARSGESRTAIKSPEGLHLSPPYCLITTL